MKRIFAMLIIVLAALLAVSCDEYSMKKDFGSLKATIEVEQDRTIQPSQEDLTCSKFSLTMRCTSAELDVIEVDFTGNTVEVDEIPAGTWQATVEGFNSSNQPTAIAPLQTIVVTAGENVTASFVLAYRTSGTGTFCCDVTFPAALDNVAKVLFELTDVATSESQTFSIVVQNPFSEDGFLKCRAEKMLTAGQYILTIQLLDSSDALVGRKVVEALNIHPYLKSAFSYAWSKEDLPNTANPVFGCASGSVLKKGTKLTLSAPYWAGIIYTTDGTEPDAMSDVYTQPIEINQSCTIKAKAFAPGLKSSEVVTAQYVVDSQSGAFSITVPSLPVSAELKDTNNVKEGISIGVTEKHDFKLSLSESYEGSATYSWYLDGELVPGADTNMFSTGSALLETGKHRLTAIAITENGICSDSIDFETVWEFDLGSLGPNGGIVVYNCHFGARDPETLGWEYMEAMPYEEGEDDTFIFGYYIPGDLLGDLRFINGEVEYNAENCTTTDFGKGEFNTNLLGLRMESATYDGKMQSTRNFAAGNVFRKGTGWFIPSKVEMEEIFNAGGFDYLEKGLYWTSSEDPRSPSFAYAFDSNEGTAISMDRSAPEMVLAVKTFN